MNAALKLDPEFEVFDSAAPLERAHLLDPRRDRKPEREGPAKWLPRWRRNQEDSWGEDGQGLAEYAVILALVAVVAIIALIYLGGQVSTILSDIGNSI